MQFVMSSTGRRWRSTRAPCEAAASSHARAGRIGLVLHDLPLGGTERIALRLAGQWADVGRGVTLFVGSDRGPLRPMVPDAVELIALTPEIARGPGSRAALARAVADAVSAQPVDVMFIPGNFHWPVAGALHGTRVVAQISAPLRRCDRGVIGQAAYNLNARWQLRRADALVSLSDAMTAEADAVFGSGRTRRIALPALDDDVPPPRPVPAGSRAIVCVGRLVPEKGFVSAVEAFARLDDPEARLTILGEGPERAAIAATAARLGVTDRVHLAGYVPDARPWLDDARLLLLTSAFEGYGAVIVEALAAGRQVVATDCSPSVAELVVPGRGAVAPVGDVPALAAALKRTLAAPPPDPIELARLVDGYRLGPAADAYLALFDEVCAR